MDKILCVIPARMGSRGIPRKNTRIVGSYPLVWHSIRQAYESGIPRQHIVVSSNDPDVLKMAQRCAVVAHNRPEEICGDTSSSELALLDALQYGDQCDAVMLLQPTSPIRLRGRLWDAIKVFREGNYDSLVSTIKLYNFLWHQDAWGEWLSTYDPQHRPMRQHLSKEDYYFFDCGNMYLTKKEVLVQRQCRLGGKICVYPVSQVESIQIDTWEDLHTVDRIMQGGVTDLSLRLLDENIPV